MPTGITKGGTCCPLCGVFVADVAKHTSRGRCKEQHRRHITTARGKVKI